MSNSMTLETLSKKDLVQHASTHPDFKKSMAREKKEVLLQFLKERSVNIETTTTAPPTPVLVVPAERPKAVSRMTKAELLDACAKKPGFNANRHGKTRTTLLEFFKGSNDDQGDEPVNLGCFLETPDNVEVIKAAILRLLMDKEPFKTDPELEAKLGKIV